MATDIAAEVSDEIKKNLAAQEAADIQDEITNQRQVNFQSSMTVAAAFEPSKFAQALKVQRDSGIPAKVAYDNWDKIEEVKQQDKLTGLFTQAPRTADALSDPNHAIVAKGDEDNLKYMERAIQKADFYEKGFFERQIAAPLRKWWNQDDIADAPGRLAQLDRITGDFDRVDAGDQFSSPWANEYRNADDAGRKAMRDNANLERNLAIDKTRVAQFNLNKMPVDPGDVAFQEAEGAADVFGVLADDPMWAGRVAAQSLPDMGQSLVAGLINPLLGGISEGATSANYKFLEVLKEKGVDPADPVQLLQALRNDDLLNEANERAARYGAGIGAVSMASFGLLNRVLAPASFAGKPLTSGTREAISAGAQIPVQGGLEALGELTGQVAERGQISDINGKEIALEGIVGGLMAGPEAGAFATKRFTQHMIQARRAERAAGLQSDLVAKSLESSTRKNDPASFEAIVGTQLAGQPNEFIEIPAAKLQELNQSGQVNIPELLENVGIDPNHYTAQVELGGTVRMKNSSYLAYLSEYDDLLASSIRVTSNDYSLDDVQELDRQMLADMEKVASQFGRTDQVASAYSDVMGQLLNAGYERGAADTTARQYAAVMTRLAEQTGQTVEDVMAANPLNIARELPEQVRRIKGDDLTLMLGRLRAGDIPKPGDMFGKSLTEYLTAAGGLEDTGGELAAFDADTGKVGRNRLARAGGQSLDAAAMAAWERGYFPGVPREEVTPNLLIDALREEAAGTPRYSVEQENATLRDQAANLEALQEFLDREGIDLATATDDDIRALLRGEQPTDQRLDQFAGPTAWTADVPALNDAKARLEAGENPEEVRKATGWFQGVDGKWRFEIDDSEAKFRPLEEWTERAEQPGAVTLRDVLDHEPLFTAYPELRRIEVRVNPGRQAGGIFVAEEGRGFTGAYIEIGDPSTYPEDSSAIDVLMHEIQHAIQAREGFATGGSAEVLRAEKDQATADFNYWRKVAFLRTEADRLNGDYEQAARDYTDIFEESITDQELQDAKSAENVEQLDARRDAAEQVMRNIGNPTNTYTRLAGEIEARNTERRRGMTAEERIAASPEQTADIPGERAIVWWRGTEMVSAAVSAQEGQQTLNQSAVASPDLQRALAMSEDEYVATVNPSGETNTEDGSARLVRGDLTDPQNAIVLVTLDNGTTIERDEDGSFYAREGGDTIGEIINYGDEVNVNVLPEARGQGVAVALAAEFIRENPFFDAGSLTPGGEAVVRAAWRKLKAEQSQTLNQSDYMMDHRPPGPEDGAPLDDLTGDGNVYPDDVYSPNGQRYYGTGHRSDAEAFRKAKAYRGEPDAPITIYRAVPVDAGDEINAGDWVAITKSYAEDHGEGLGDFKVISKQVKAGEIFTSGDSIQEWGYWPGGEQTLEQSTQGDDARGSITFGPRKDDVRRFDIRLGKKSDLSTVLHEMGHYYLEVIGDLVQDGKANEALTGDYAVIRDWLGAEAGKPLTVDQHEQFARGFEKYLAEGKAPSIELQNAFARFKRWLVGIYKDLRRLDVEISPEVRSVFDRLLASEEAIAEAEEALALSEKYESSITALMTPEELANYQRAAAQARDEATSEIEQDIIKAERRKQEDWYKDQRRATEKEVRDELEASQPYQARKYLFGNIPHPQLGRPLRLDTAAVTELFGTKSKEARFLGRSRVKRDGVHPDIAASLLGYMNPAEMLNDMRSVVGLSEAVKLETDRRMAERYPDPRTDGALAEKAMAAVGEREAEVQAIQLRALAREAGRKPSQHRIIKEAARQHIARLRLRDVIPYTFQRASTKAAKAVEEALLAGNLPKAYEEKEKQLMNLHLYREAVKAQELAQKKRDQAKAYMKPGAKRKRLQEASVENYELAYPDGRIEYAATKAAAKRAEEEGAVVTPLFNFLEQVDQLLTKYEFGIPRRAIRQQREALAQFLASMADEHIVVNPPEWLLLDRAQRTNWKELTIGELEDVVDMIRQIDQMAKNKLMVLKGDKWEEFEPIRDSIISTVELNASKARNSQFNKSFADDIRRWGREWLGLLPADQIARELDGQDDLGPVQENITTPIQVAGRNAVIREKAEFQGLADLVRQFYSEDQIKGMNDPSKLIAIQEIGDSMTRMQMVMLMANLGNEGNRQALLSEQRSIWTAETIQAVMSRLDSNDADFVEALWAWIDKFWPEVAENEAKRTGVAPAKVAGDPYPVKLADGKIRVLKGGYFPLKYDGDLSIKTSQDEVGNAFKNMTAGRTAKAYTPEGHRIERVGSGGRPVKLDFSVVTSHVGEVVRDIVMTDPVNQSWRFLHDREVQGAFERSNLKELFTALEIWMQDTAEGEKVDSGYMTASARWLRTGFTANVMLFNIANSLLNLAGTHPLVVLGKRWALQGYRNAFSPDNWNQMYELSSFMREARIESYNKDLALVQDQMAGKGGWRSAMTTAGFYLHNKTQMFMDAVTWMGAYEKGMSMDLTGQALVTYADQRVVEASGSGVFADRAALERGTLSRQTRQNELVRGLTMLAGYMIRKMAIARRRTAETSFKDIGQAMNWAVDMALLFTVEGLMFALVKGNVPDEEDEDQALEWAKTAGWETFASVGSGLPPFGRPVVAGIQGFGGGTSSIDIFAEQFGNAVTQAKQGDADITAAKALVAMIGTATKTPGIATNRVIDWLDRAGSGDTPPWYELFTGNRDK